MSARLRLTLLAGLLLLGACASAPEPEPEVEIPTEDPRITAVLAQVKERLAADPEAVPRGLDISISEIRDLDGQLTFGALFALPEARARDAQEFTVYASCPSTDVAACAAKLADAARSLK